MIVLGKSIKIFLNRVIGPVVFIWLLYSIYRQIALQPDLHQSLRYIQESIWGYQSWKFWLCILLAAVNWGLEARKWQIMLHPLQQVSYWKSVKGVLAGVAFAVNTPNRIGEYGGRMLYLQPDKRVQSIGLTVLASISQLIVTLLFGALALTVMDEPLSHLAFKPGVPTIWFQMLYSIVMIAAIVCLLFYFKMDWMLILLERIPMAGKLLPFVKVVGEVDVTILLRVLGLSTIRYVVFVSQYILLLQLMHVELELAHAFCLISILYLILALVPTVALLEIGLRGKLGIMLFQLYSSNIVGIYAATTGIWLLNLVVPALAGSMMAAGVKIFNTRK